jgi:hypothetical protein
MANGEFCVRAMGTQTLPSGGGGLWIANADVGGKQAMP